MKWSAGVVAGALVMLVAACGNAPSGSHTSSKTPAPTAQALTASTSGAPDLTAELLTTSDLSGWSATGNSAIGEPKCLDSARSALQAISTAQATFADGSIGLPVLEESLYYRPGHGQSGMTMLSQRLAGCGPIKMSSSGVTVTGSLGSLPFPAIADQSSAYQMNLTGTVSGQSASVDIDVVVFRKADTLAIILYGNIGTVGAQALQPIVHAAAAKLS